jgi:2-dehydro-3-deoxyphosphogluconate aldolase/(4S)-4-hydroxy-2-oxoglutarate aldolase
MASHDKAEVLATIARDGVVPVFYDPDVEVARSVARCLVAGGLTTLEFTNRGDGAVRVFAELVAWARRELPELVVGVGTVTHAATAVHVLDIGADFVFGPTLDADVAAACHERNVPYVPGCATLTEIVAAYRLGCDRVKLFPADAVGGPSFLRAVRAPCPWVQAIPTGGVEPTVASLRAWYGAGAPAVGMGSKLLTKDLIEVGDWDGLERTVLETVAAVAEARGVAAS